MTSAIDKAITEFEILSSFPQYSFDYVNLIKELKACKEALAQPAQEVGDAEIKQMLDDIEYYQKRIEELEQPAQEPVAWMKSALDNARDVCKYLDHDMIKEAKAHTKFFWDDIEKIKEPDTHPAPSWQVLSDDEIVARVFENEELLNRILYLHGVSKGLEQALKEKNYV